MGVVYEAEDRRLGRRIALKFLPEHLSNERQAADRFRREARAASALNHPHICTIYDVGDYGGQQFIAMELLRGDTLRKRLTGPLPPRQAVEWAIQIADALEAAHAQGIIHRDIKPANIFVTDRGAIKVLDFGLAKVTRGVTADAAGHEPGGGIREELLTSPGAPVGTVAYMSPEQARGQDLDARTDLFSLGAVLYEMVTGRLAFEGRTAAIVSDSLLNRSPAAPAAFNPDVPPELERIIAKAIEKEPAARYQTASELKADLERLEARSWPVRAPAHARTLEIPDRSLHQGTALAWTRLDVALVAAAILALPTLFLLFPRAFPVSQLRLPYDRDGAATLAKRHVTELTGVDANVQTYTAYVNFVAGDRSIEGEPNPPVPDFQWQFRWTTGTGPYASGEVFIDERGDLRRFVTLGYNSAGSRLKNLRRRASARGSLPVMSSSSISRTPSRRSRTTTTTRREANSPPFAGRHSSAPRGAFQSPPLNCGTTVSRA